MKNTIDFKAERARRSREKFLETWGQITPKLTIMGLVDDTIGNVIRQRGSQSLISSTIVASAVWLFSAVRSRRSHFKFSKTKTATLKQEKNYENSHTI